MTEAVTSPDADAGAGLLPTSTALPITGLPRAGVPRLALVVGDPARAVRIGEFLIDGRPLASLREYVSWIGRWAAPDGTESEVVVASHGVGAAGAICLFEELHVAGVRRIIRLGTAGAMSPDLRAGDAVIAEAAVRDDGVTQQMLPPEYPAFATPELVLALEAAAVLRGVPARRSIAWTRALFHPGLLPLPTSIYTASGVTALEMELSALYVHGAARGYQRAGLLVVDGVSADDAPYDPHTAAVRDGVGAAAAVALDALVSPLALPV
jgi:uridine phosphorylase